MWRKLIPKWLKEKIRPITEMHVECIDVTCLRVMKWARNNPNAILMLIPQSPEKIKFLLQTCVNPIGLHVHLDSDIYSPKGILPDYKSQLSMIKTGIEFFNDLGIRPEDFVSGHWNYNYSTFKACKELGLRKIHIKCSEISTALFCGVPEGLTIIPVHKHIHDYDLCGGLENVKSYYGCKKRGKIYRLLHI